MMNEVRTGRLLRMALGALALLHAAHGAAQAGCFRTVNQALRGAGEQDVSGFRVEATTWDTYRGSAWTRVRSCGHPERPLLMVKDVARLREAGHPALDAEIKSGKSSGSEAAVRAGSPVLVVSEAGTVRMEFAATAAESGRIGQAIRARVSVAGQERLVTAVVKSTNVLELVP